MEKYHDRVIEAIKVVPGLYDFLKNISNAALQGGFLRKIVECEYECGGDLFKEYILQYLLHEGGDINIVTDTSYIKSLLYTLMKTYEASVEYVGIHYQEKITNTNWSITLTEDEMEPPFLPNGEYFIYIPIRAGSYVKINLAIGWVPNIFGFTADILRYNVKDPMVYGTNDDNFMALNDIREKKIRFINYGCTKKMFLDALILLEKDGYTFDEDVLQKYVPLRFICCENDYYTKRKSEYVWEPCTTVAPSHDNSELYQFVIRFTKHTLKEITLEDLLKNEDVQSIVRCAYVSKSELPFRYANKSWEPGKFVTTTEHTFYKAAMLIKNGEKYVCVVELKIDKGTRCMYSTYSSESTFLKFKFERATVVRFLGYFDKEIVEEEGKECVAYSFYDKQFEYKKGKIVEPKFSYTELDYCGDGIHAFASLQEAWLYDYIDKVYMQKE